MRALEFCLLRVLTSKMWHREVAGCSAGTGSGKSGRKEHDSPAVLPARGTAEAPARPAQGL